MSTQLSLMDKVVERSEAGAVRRWLALLEDSAAGRAAVGKHAAPAAAPQPVAY